MGCGREHNITSARWYYSAHVREGAKLVRQPTPSGWMKYIQPMQYIPPRAAYATYPAILIHKSAFRSLNFRRLLSISCTSANERFSYNNLYQPLPRTCAMSPEGVDGGRRLGRGVRMDRKFSRRRQGGGSRIRTGLSIP